MSLKLRLAIIILSLMAIPLLFVSAITFSNYKNSLTTSRLSQLQELARFKAEEINAYFEGLKNTVEMSQGFYNVRKNLPVLARSQNDPQNRDAADARKMLDGQLVRMQKVLDLSDIMLADKKGRIVYVSNPEHYTKDLFRSIEEISPESLKQGAKDIYFSDIFINEIVGGMPEILVIAPISGLNGGSAGTIIFEIGMAPLYRLIQDTIGLGATGEILIGKKSGNDIVYLNPLRHDTTEVLMRRIHIGDNIGLPLQNAVSGETGTGQSVDYRGKKVVAAWRHIAFPDWGLVAKIDTREEFAVVTNLQRLLIMVLALVFVMAGVITFSVAQSISVPIQKLTKGAEIIGSGNLDHRVGMNLNDEIGRLSRSFDKMTQDLKETTASRDELNKEIEIRKRSEEALRESEASLKRAQEISHLGSWELDLTNNRLTWSDEVYRIFGLAPQEFGATYEAFLAAIHPDDRAAVDAAYSGSLRENKDSYEIDHRVVRKGSGEVRIVHEKCEHFRDAEGKIFRSVGMVHDITERKQAAEELRLRTEELKASNEELTFFNRTMAGREERMIELKTQVNELCKKLGQPPAYDVDFGEEQ